MNDSRDAKRCAEADLKRRRLFVLGSRRLRDYHLGAATPGPRLNLVLFGSGFYLLVVFEMWYPLVQRVGWATWIVGATIFFALLWARKCEGNDAAVRPAAIILPLTILPWLGLVVLVANAGADSSPPVAHAAIVEWHSTTLAQTRYGSWLTTVIEVSWKTDGVANRFAAVDACNGLADGSQVTVIERGGALGLPWIAGIAECVPRAAPR